MNILAVDPGSEQSAWVLYSIARGSILDKGLEDNEKVLIMIRACHQAKKLVIEYPQPRGQMLTSQLVTTVYWIGRFVQAWGQEWHKVDRKDVKMCLCGNARAKDKNIRAALIELFPQTGGGKTPGIGTKKQPGPLYGFRDDLWAALAVAYTWAEAQKEKEMFE